MSANLFFRFFLFILITILDVRVRAFTIEEPSNCSKMQNSQCLFYTNENIETLATETAVVKLKKKSTLVRNANDSLKIIRGLFIVDGKVQTTIHTLFGDLVVQGGEVLIEASDVAVKFVNLSSAMKYTPRGESKSYDLPVGFATYFAKITKSGVADTGYPHPAEIVNLIKSWSQFYTYGEKQKFMNELKDFRAEWSKATSLVGPWYRDTVAREIASHEAEQARKARLKAKQEAENAKYRNMFRQRIFE